MEGRAGGGRAARGGGDGRGREERRAVGPRQRVRDGAAKAGRSRASKHDTGTPRKKGEGESPGTPQSLRGPNRRQHARGGNTHATGAPVFPQEQTGLGGRAKALASDAPVFCDRSAREPAAFFGWVMSATVWAMTDPCRKSSKGGMKAAEITSYHSPRNRIRSSRSRPGGGAEIAKVLCAR